MKNNIQNSGRLVVNHCSYRGGRNPGFAQSSYNKADMKPMASGKGKVFEAKENIVKSAANEKRRLTKERDLLVDQGMDMGREWADLDEEWKALDGKTNKSPADLARMTVIDGLKTQIDAALSSIATEVQKVNVEIDKQISIMQPIANSTSGIDSKEIFTGDHSARGTGKDLSRTTEIGRDTSTATSQEDANRKLRNMMLAEIKDGNLNSIDGGLTYTRTEVIDGFTAQQTVKIPAAQKALAMDGMQRAETRGDDPIKAFKDDVKGIRKIETSLEDAWLTNNVFTTDL